jgi:hypothetical protein
MKHIQNNKKTIGKSISAYGFKKSFFWFADFILVTFAKCL